MATWSTAFINDLPDSSFLFIQPGGKKDETGKTTPRSLRHLPYKDSAGKVDLPHLRNALARLDQLKGVSTTTKNQLRERAEKILAAERERLGLSFASEAGVMEQVGKSKYIKDAIRVGNYRMPSDGREVPVDESRIDTWIDHFFSMQEHGVKVPVLGDHSEDTPSERKSPSERTKGYVTDMFRKDDTLYYVQEFGNRESETLATTVDQVSINVEPDFVDGEGREYGEAITHIALTPKPVVPGQNSFIPMSMIRVKDKEIEEMDEVLTKLKESFGIETDLTEENVVEVLTGEHTKLTEQLADMQKARDTIAASLDAERNQKPKEKNIEPEVLDVLNEATDAKLDGLVSMSRITPAVRDKFKAIIADEKVQPFMLSRTVSGTPKSVVNQILDVLKDNNVVDTTEKTGTQVLSMSQEQQDAEKAQVDSAAEIAKRFNGE